jgi:hypothetical protein
MIQYGIFFYRAANPAGLLVFFLVQPGAVVMDKMEIMV